MKISSREREIMAFLLNAEKDITVKAIATELGVSVRTVHRDLKSIEKILPGYNLALMKKSGVGLQITGDKAGKDKLEQDLTDVSVIDFSPEERRTVILATLLEMNEPLKLFTLATELHVTEATISQDLDQLEQELAMFHLTLIRKRGYGVEIKGKETDKRAALSHVISQYVDPFEFVSLIKTNIQKESAQQLTTISGRLLDFINPNRLQLIERVVEDARDALPYGLADSAHIGLVVHLALAMERLQKGESIKFDQAFLQQIEQSKEFAIAKKIIRELERKLDLSIPDDEIGYITMHLMGAKLRVDQEYLVEESSIDIAYQAKALINYVSTNIGIDLTNDSRLLHDLVAHLKPAIYRLQQNMRIINPLLNNIKNDYDDLFQVIQDGVRDIYPDVVFPEDEIGYLVLHFASTLLNDRDLDLRALVICSSGIGTAKMLATKLMQKVPEVKRVDNQSFFDLKHLDLDTYDLIVSTIPLNGFDREYIQTSPMLSNEEVHRIKKMVKQKKLTFHSASASSQHDGSDQRDSIARLEDVANYSQAILDLLQSLHVERLMGEQPLEVVLQGAIAKLELEHRIKNKNQVVKKLRDREQISGLGIPGTSCALYHTRSSDIISPSFSVYIVAHPLTVQGMDNETMRINTILLMLAPEKASSEVLEVFSYLSSLLVQDEESIALFSTGEKENVQNYLAAQYRKFLQEKNLL